MTNKDFLLEVHKLCHIESQQCVTMINALCKLMAQAGVEQVPVSLPGLGTFVSHKHPEYMQEDPQTGRMTLYPPRITYRMQSLDPEVPSDILVHQLAEQTKTSEAECLSLLKAFVEVIFGSLDHGEEVEVKGLGAFRNIVTRQGELQRVAYTPDAQMRTMVNAPFNCFESVVADDPSLIADETAAAVAAIASEAADLNAAVAEEAPTAVEVQSADAEATSLVVEEESAVAEADSTPVEEPAAMAEPSSEAVDNVPEVDGTTPTAVEVLPQEAEPAAEAADAESQVEEATPTASEVVPAVTETTNNAAEPVEQVKEATSAPANTVPSSNIDKSSHKKHDDEDYFESLHHRPNRTRNYLLYTACSILVLAGAALIWWIMNIDNESEDRIPTLANLEEELIPEPTVAEDTLAFIEDAAVDTVVATEPTEVVEEPTLITENQTPQKPAEPVAEPAKPAKTASTAPITEQMYSHNADGSIATHKLQEGERLTLVALKYYGDKCFWPYIYEVNTDKIKSPSLVSAGMVLRLPDAAYFGIDAHDAKSINKAKAKAAKLLN